LLQKHCYPLPDKYYVVVSNVFGVVSNVFGVVSNVVGVDSNVFGVVKRKNGAGGIDFTDFVILLKR